jgi:WD40 repeat protein
MLSGGGDYSGGTCNDPGIRLWDMKTGEELPRFNGELGVTNCVAFSSDGRLAVSCGWDTAIQVWDVRAGKEIRRFGEGDLNSVALSPDGKQVLSGGGNQGVRLWDIESGKQVRQFHGHRARVEAVAIAPDGRYAASCAGAMGGNKDLLGSSAFPIDCTIRIWDLKTGKELHRFGDSYDHK